MEMLELTDEVKRKNMNRMGWILFYKEILRDNFYDSRIPTKLRSSRISSYYLHYRYIRGNCKWLFINYYFVFKGTVSFPKINTYLNHMVWISSSR